MRGLSNENTSSARDGYTARCVERYRKALMREHAGTWDMETVSEAAHICARAQADAVFGAS